MVCDAASIAVMVERIGCHNARWRRIKRSDFLGNIENQDILSQEIVIAQQPESSLSSESSTDSSFSSETNIYSKRKRSVPHTAVPGNAAKVSSSSDSSKTNYPTEDKNNHSYSPNAT